MTARTVAGWVAAGTGFVLLLGIAGSAIAASTGLTSDAGTASWTMDHSMMGPGQMGPGMMRSGQMGPGMMGPGMMGFSSSGPASTAIPSAPEVRVQAANFSFTPTEIRLPKSADANLTLANPAATGVAHDLTVPVLGIHIVANAGETKTLGLRGLAAGRYDAYCGVPGHADLGMRATVIVD